MTTTTPNVTGNSIAFDAATRRLAGTVVATNESDAPEPVIVRVPVTLSHLALQIGGFTRWRVEGPSIHLVPLLGGANGWTAALVRPMPEDTLEEDIFDGADFGDALGRWDARDDAKVIVHEEGGEPEEVVAFTQFVPSTGDPAPDSGELGPALTALYAETAPFVGEFVVAAELGPGCTLTVDVDAQL